MSTPAPEYGSEQIDPYRTRILSLLDLWDSYQQHRAVSAPSKDLIEKLTDARVRAKFEGLSSDMKYSNFNLLHRNVTYVFTARIPSSWLRWNEISTSYLTRRSISGERTPSPPDLSS